MSKAKRFTSYVLILMLGILLLRPLFPAFFAKLTGDCQEFGHVHLHKTEKMNAGPSLAIADDDCHEGKSVLVYLPLPDRIFTAVPLDYALAYELIYRLENHFLSPSLEPSRKPPKFISELTFA